MKTCEKCKKVKEDKEFIITLPGNIIVKSFNCQTCFDMINSVDYKEEIDEEKKTKKRRYNLKSMHNITPEEYDQMIIDQGDRCKLCGDINLTGKDLVIHSQGWTKFLVCYKCNIILSNIKTIADAERLLRFIKDFVVHKEQI